MSAVSIAPERVVIGLHRDGIAAVDKLPTIVITAAKQDGVVGVMAASEHKVAVAPGNRYGATLPTAIVAVTPTLNKTIDIAIPPCTGAEWYDIFFSTDAAPLWVGRITEAQRIAGCAITAVGTVAAGGGAGTKQVETLTVTAGASKAGNLTISLTSALFASVVTLDVALAATDITVALVATKIRAALNAHALISPAFTAAGTAGAVVLTAVLAAANDSTLALALVDDGDTGVTADSSADTTAGVAPVAQVETATAAGTITTAGLGTATITSVLWETPIVVNIPLLLNDNANAIALAARTAIAANATVAAHYTVSGATDKIILTAKVAAANDETLNIALADKAGEGGAVGITAAPTSADTTAGVAPVKQVETFTVTAPCTKSGTLVLTVTAAGMTGSPKTVNVSVSALHSTTARVGERIRAALAADASVSAFFDVSGTGADGILTAKTAAANDATMAIALTNDGSTSVTVSASGDTTAGAAPTTNVRLVGTGVATTADPFKMNNAYKLDNAEEILCRGKNKAYIFVKATVTDLRSAPTLSILPFLKNATTGDYTQGTLQAVTLLTALGKSLLQVFSIDLDGAEGLKVLVDAIGGQGTKAYIYIELA